MFIPLERLINLEEGYRRRFVVNGLPVVLLVVDGRPVLIEAQCPHQGASLEKGTLAERAIRCPQHGILFSLDSGKALNAHCPSLRVLDIAYDQDLIGIDV
ncbi:nitrite reductase/ring-hydroxylating ferredoxin subunit [Pseudomonas duriflava]|uniref:Nitrite reductase/ring-hydroxylating ferredoxin subunit n=1 Tax=Pseudomonas duriflava TaxID=459528 RepID=A0A562Q9M5_9PSED|nr:Rieske (2Fe-2S) protein [Pseudomonas duriflava]TWI53481.1 nitrite reductase/ring-hydroxylating ferredoxin subunit [Pseudomonas duriflava]